MIIIKIKGGLGNQMFQYALGRSISLCCNKAVKFDLFEFEKYKLHNYSLDCFDVKVDIATKDDLRRFGISYHNNRLIHAIFRRIQNSLIINSRYKLKNEEYQGGFDRSVFEIKNDVYLDGYWQNEKYFKEIEDVIRKDFSFKEKPNKLNSNYLDKIEKVNSVSLHIRRGDYASNPKTLKFHGLLGLDYYEKAVEIIENNIKNPEFFVFSDDIEWAKDNLKINYPVNFVNNNSKEKGYEDLRLMMNCKNNVIANSTFSWWGAWLNNNPEKIVIAPSQWFSKEEMEKRKNWDIIPKEWKKI